MQELIDKIAAWGMWPKLLSVLVIVVVGLLVCRLVMSFVRRALNKSKLEKAAHSLICSVVRVVLYGLLILIAASALGIDVTGVVALASVVTLALSLALQNSLTNLIGGFTLLYTHPFTSGDYVEIAGQSGTVQEIGMAYTKLTTPDNKTVSIPNSSVVGAEIVNYTVTGTRRVDVEVTASYDAPIQKVIAALREAADVPQRLEDKDIFAEVMNYGDSSISYAVRIWTTGADYWTAKFDIQRRIKEIFDREGIEMTYPHLNVHIQDK